MSLTLYMHPLSSYCWKVLVGLYENATPFTAQVVDLGNEASRAAFLRVWPIGKFPVLRDEARGRTIPESSIILEYLSQHHPGAVALVPADPESALEARLWDRFYDHYVHEPMQKIVGDRLRPPGEGDPLGVEQARERLRTAYGMIEPEMAKRTWAAGEAFTLADCAAAPALHYANRVVPLGDGHKSVAAYLRRLEERPSFARVLREAQPYAHLFPN
ncbi:MAG: glutathione S-transferase family protein [Polyangia bacterium]